MDGPEQERRFRQLLDGQLTAAEFAQLEEHLKSDPQLRTRYVKFMDLEACLADELSHRAEIPLVAARPRRLWPWLMVLAATAACLIIAVNFNRGPDQVINAGKPVPAIDPAANYVAAPLQGLPVVAVVTALDGISPAPQERLEVGTRLKAGIIKLTNGELQLDFLGGARVLLSAPAELHMVSNSSATLVSGAAGVRVRHAQKGFVLNTPDVAVVDVGTEFAVRVDTERHTHVHVYTGEVEISVLGDDGNTLISQRLAERGTVMVDPQARLFTSLASPTVPLPRVREPDAADLVVTEAYVHEVQKSKPYLYWRFDELEDGVVRDASGNAFDAHIVGAAEDASAIRVAGGVAEFRSSPGPRSLVTVNPVQHFNSGDFSVELWVMPAELSQAVVLGVLLPNEHPIPMHLNLIELAHNTALVHQPGVIRFLHRQPARRLGGYNLFSQDICIPGTWTHVVATKAADELKLYVNGQLLRTVTGPGTGGSDDLGYHIMLGQLGPVTKERQFNGLIDEVAVYRRVLPANEISRHYWSIVRRPAATAALVPARPDLLEAGGQCD